MMTNKLLRLFALVVSGLFLNIPSAWSQTTGQDPLAVIGSTMITEDDLLRELSGRPNAFATLPPSDRRARMLEVLVAEHLVDYFYGQNPDQLTDAVREAIISARRQILMQLYTQWRFDPPNITDEDIESYILDHPWFFEERAMYQFVIIQLDGGSDAARQQAVERLRNVNVQPDDVMSQLNTLIREFRQSGMNATLSNLWTPSEALAETARLRLQSMVAENRKLDVESGQDSINILLLTGFEPVPISPNDIQREQIEARLLAADYEDQTERLIARLAASVLEDGASTQTSTGGTLPVEIEVPTAGTVAWGPQSTTPEALRLAGFSASWLFGLVGLYANFTWVRTVRAQHSYLKSERSDLPLSKRTGFSYAFGLLLLLLLVAVLAIATWFGDLIFGLRTGVVFMAGALVVAMGLCWTWWDKDRRGAQKTETSLHDFYTDESMVHRQVVMRQDSKRYFLAAVGLLAAASAGVAVMLGYPLS